jgi:hypothetical protein
MAHSTNAPDLGHAHGRHPDRGAASGHTPADHAEHRRPEAKSDKPDHADAKEKARPRDTSRSGA